MSDQKEVLEDTDPDRIRLWQLMLKPQLEKIPDDPDAAAKRRFRYATQYHSATLITLAIAADVDPTVIADLARQMKVLVAPAEV